jgi:lipopolysaccharide export system protein LptA
MMQFPFDGRAAAAVLTLALLAVPALAQQPARAAQGAVATQPPAPAKPEAKAKDSGRGSPLGGLGTNSKEPIKIDSDRLDVYDKEGRAVFAGNVVAVQGESTIRCTAMTVFYEKNKTEGAAKSATPTGAGDNSIKKIDCAGPVTVVSKTQVATADNATFDKAANKVFLIGNAALTDGPNVTRGERIVYDLDTGVANIETTPGGRVKALFMPNNGNNAEGGAKTEAKPATPAAAPAAAKPKRPATASN